MAYVKPQTIIHQEFTAVTSPTTESLRAVVVGPNAKLHRYNVSDEKNEIYGGTYALDNGAGEVLIPFQGRTGIVDTEYTKLYIDNALLEYYSDPAVAASSAAYKPKYHVWDTGNDPVSVKHANGIVSDATAEAVPAVNFATIGSATRAAALGSRDVKVGDYALLHATVPSAGGTCTDSYHFSRIIDLIYDETTPTIGLGEDITHYATTAAAAPAIVEYRNNGDAIAEGSELLEVSGTFNGLALGVSSITYEITVVQGTAQNCSAPLRFRAYSPELREVCFFTLAQPTSTETTATFGSAGFIVTISAANYSTLLALINENTSVHWLVSATQFYTAPTFYSSTQEGAAESNSLIIAGSYNGGIDDTLFIQCVEGGTVTESAGSIKINVYSAISNQVIRNLTLTSTLINRAIPLGSSGVTIKAASESFSMYTGQTISVPLTGSTVSAVRGFMLADELPEDMQLNANGLVSLDLRLMTCADITIKPEDGFFNQEATQIVVPHNATITYATILDSDGEPRNLPIAIRAESNFNKLYLEYREWLPDSATSLNLCEGIAGLDMIGGQLDPENPLKYAVYKALANSNGASVGYVAVTDPEDLDDWQTALSIIEGRDDVYTVVPTTQDSRIQNLVATLVDSESSAEACHWKSAIFSCKLIEEKLLVGQSDSTVTPTCADPALPVMAEFIQDTEATGSPYTLLTLNNVGSGSSAIPVQERVKPGDVVRCTSMVNDEQVEYIVDHAISNTTIKVLSGPATQKTCKVNIWHKLNKSEQATEVGAYAQDFANRRIGLCWPDTVVENGVELPGYYLAAALAGLKSGVSPVQGLTRVEVSGFNDYSRSRPYFTESQLNTMAGSGVWIVCEDSDGTPHSRHAVNTSTVDINYREELMTRNFDSICKYLFTIVDRFIGVELVNEATLNNIYHQLSSGCEYLKGRKQINSYSSISVQQHDLLADRVEVRIIASLPYAVNNVELYITAEKTSTDAVTTTIISE